MKIVKNIFSILLILVLAAGWAGARDLRPLRLYKFLGRYRSPLCAHVNEIVYCADKYRIDYRLYVALSGAESGFGRNFPKNSSNFTGIMNGATHFPTIFANIDYTSRLIGQGKWYKTYRRTQKLEDLVYVYKAVPPYERYLRTVRYSLNKINSMDIAEEKKIVDRERKLARMEQLGTWAGVRYDRSNSGRSNKVDYKTPKANEQLTDWGGMRYDQLPKRVKVSIEH
jgi:hypothetical protein